MAAADGLNFSISMASLVENVLREHGNCLSDKDLASRKAEEAVSRRYEAAGWLRRTVGVVGSKDLPNEPSEEEFRLGLRSGLILCTALNKVHHGAVPKVVINPEDSMVLPDGAALSAYQYFENVRNFLVAGQELGLPTFEASDLEQGGKSSRVVDCVLALKSYGEWKQMGGHGSWKYGGTLKPANLGKSFMRKNAEPFMRSLSRNQSVNGKELSGELSVESSEMNSSHSLNKLVHVVLSDKKPEEVPMLVESMLNKIMEEFERRVASQNEMVKTALKGLADENKSFSKLKISAEPAPVGCERKIELEDNHFTKSKKESCVPNKKDEESNDRLHKQQLILDQQQRNIQELKHTLWTTRAGIEFMQKKHYEEFGNLGKHLHGLAHAASGYHKVLEENRKLYNQVQDLKGSIRVYCRVRPFLPGQLSSNTIGSIDEGNITIITPSKYCKEGRRSFNFNKVFGPSDTQDEVFSDTQPLIRSVLDGYNVCIFAYGQTGSGKTYTMSGPRIINEQSQGVNYRALGDLFNLAKERRGMFSYEIAVQMIEIYNEQVRDLLVSDGLNRRYPFFSFILIILHIEIRNGSQNGLNVPDANLVSVMSTSDVVELMNIGQKNRVVGATALNDRSSRSHSCLTVHVEGKDLTSGTVLRGCMHLVDLAGSERVDKSEVTGERLKEAQHINKSLSALGDVISALAQKNSHVPYRNSKLTQLLQDSLGGQAKTLMFVHISPEMDSVGETISTLKFAERVSTVELGAARLNRDNGEVKELKEQISSLKAALARREGECDNVRNSNTPKLKSSTPPSFYSNRQHGGDSLSCQIDRQPMEEVGNIEVHSNLASRQRKASFDLQELLMSSDSHPWSDNSPSLNIKKGYEKEIGSGDWVDKVMVNKYEAAIRNDIPVGDWEGDGGHLPDIFNQRYMPDTRVYADHKYSRNTSMKKESHEFEIQKSRFDSADDSDDLDFATSDSSEADVLWQLNLPKVTSSVNGSGSRTKKPQTKPANSPDLRTPNHSLIPPPSRKTSSGSGRLGRQSSSNGFDGKRIPSGGKTSSGK
ncbi:Uncharacterized protein M6B38_232000 [Iris pallida]|uniref:Uncharacterized protein n=1 Tax=Iris pallida TaxID=29817 RepID=A0AAX6DRB0_IRIPA|nr:Uncharacterized protein M6B38_232000 [Iris pallida]